MAISYVGGQTTVFTGATGGASETVAMNGLTGGSNSSPSADDLVVITYVTGSAADRALTINSTGYTLVSTEQYANGTTYDTNLHVEYKYLTTAETSISVSRTGNAQDAGACAVQVFRGVDPTTQLDVTAQPATGTGTGRPNPAQITPSTAGAWVVVCYGSAALTGTAYTSPSDVTNFISATSPDTNDAMVGMGTKTNWTSGAFDPAAISAGGTANAADSWAAMTLVLRPATAPSWTSSNTANVAENATLSYTMTATNSPTFSIVGGADQALFEVSGSTLRWLSNGTKNFESPDDSDTNNTYVVTLRATNAGGTADLTVTVTVTNALEVTLAALSGSLSVDENVSNGTVVGTPTGYTSGSTKSLQDDAGGRFAINSSTGQITVANGSLLNYESATTHNVTVRETHADGSNSPRDTVLAIAINDVDEIAPTITSRNLYRILPRKGWSTTLTANEAVTWTKTGGANAADFTLAGSTLSLGATAPGVTKVVQVTATDAASNATNQTITVNTVKSRRGTISF